MTGSFEKTLFPEGENARNALEDQYMRDGIDTYTLNAHLEALVAGEAEWRNEGSEHGDSFYLNSSDPLRTMESQLDVHGSSVLSVVGSGDFLPMWLGKGARDVELFDVSSFAILWNELKYAGLQRLSFEEFGPMFMGWKNISPQREYPPFFDLEIYEKLRPGLTPQARWLFDELRTPKYHSLLTQHQGWGGFARERRKGQSYIGTVVDAKQYPDLQALARERTFKVRKADIYAMADSDHRFPEVVYLSNIGYQPAATVELAEKLLARGATRVLATWPWTDQFYRAAEISSSGKVVEARYQLPEKEYQESKKEKWTFVPSYKNQVLLPGTTFLYTGTLRSKKGEKKKSANVTLVGSDPDNTLATGLLVEISKEKNPEF